MVTPSLENRPDHYDLSVAEGDLICVNSTVPYLTVVFQHTNFLKVRVFSSTVDDSTLIPNNRLIIPSEFSGLGFGNVFGHLEIQALLTGRVSFSAFAFPSTCSTYRYVTSMKKDTIHLGSVFGLTELGNPTSSKLCIWSIQPKTTFTLPVAEEIRDSIELCETALNCSKPLLLKPEGAIFLDVSDTNFLQFDADNPRFSNKIQIHLQVREIGQFFDSWQHLKNSQKIDLIPITRRVEVPEIQKQTGPDNIVAPGDQPAHPFHHKEASKIVHTIQITAILTLGAVAIMMIIRYAAKKPLKYRLRGDESEQRLLPEGDLERFASFPPVFPGSYQQYVHPVVDFPAAESFPTS